MLLKGHRQGGTHTRRNAQKAVCGQRRSHVIEGAIGKAVHTEGGAHTRQNTQKAVCGHRMSHVIEGATGKAVHTKGGAHTRRNAQKAVCGHCRSHVIEGAIGKAVHTEGGAHKRRSVAIARFVTLIAQGTPHQSHLPPRTLAGLKCRGLLPCLNEHARKHPIRT